MKNNSNFAKGLIKSGSALQALALLGAGVFATGMIATPAFAQDYTNINATGRVVSTDGSPVVGATVTMTSNGQGFVRTVTTDSDGSFRISQVPTGSYTFAIDASGYDSFNDANVQLTQDKSANQFALAPAGGSGDIVVTAGRIQIVDFERTTTGAVIDIGELATRVPVARDLTSVIQLAPGTTFGDTAFGNLPNIAGASVAENAYYINGLNITEFREGLGSVTVPFEFYQTIEVKSGGFPAEFGRTTGGVVNAVTKSGSNEFHAGLLVNWEPDDLSSRAKDTVFSENSREKGDRINTTFFASGPIIKDRLFIYGLYEVRNVTTENTITSYGRVGTTDAFNQVGSRVDRNSTTSPFYAVKVDAIPFDGHRLEFTYFNTSGKTNTQSFGYTAYNDTLTTAEAGYGAAQGTSVAGFGGENYVGRYTGNFTDWLTISGAYGVNKFRDTTGSSDDSYPFITDSRNGNASIGNAINVINRNFDKREFYRADVDLYVDLFGSHHFKAGYDRENLTTASTTSYTGNVAYTYFNSGAAGDNVVSTPNTDYVSARTFINGGVFKSMNEAFYIQDSWSLFNDRLTLQIGARNDRFENKNAAGAVYYASGDNWAPRLGFSGDVFGDGQTKIYGSFGRYFLPIAANTNIRLAGAELDYTRFNILNGLNANNTPIVGAPILGIDNSAPCPDTSVVNCTINSDGVATPTESTVSKNLKAQAVDEWIIGAEHKFGGGWSAGLYYTKRKLVRALEDVAIDAAVNQYCEDEGIATYEECSSIYSGFHQYVLTNPGSDATITLSDPLPGETEVRTIDFTAAQLGYPKATRKYDAVTVQFERAFDGKWSLQGSYTWSKLKGNYEGAVKSDNGQTDAGLTTDFDQPGLTNGAFGFSPNHREHNFKLFGSYQLTDWLLIGANATAISPRKFGCIGRIPTAIDAFGALYGAAGNYCVVDAQGNIVTDERLPLNTNNSGALVPRGTAFKSDWRTQTNLSFVFRLPTEAFQGDFRVDVFNVFNEKAALDFEERGTLGNGRPRNTYQQPTSYQGPRSVRLQLGLRF